jgi:hypothetical protein
MRLGMLTRLERAPRELPRCLRYIDLGASLRRGRLLQNNRLGPRSLRSSTIGRSELVSLRRYRSRATPVLLGLAEVRHGSIPRRTLFSRTRLRR